MGPPHDKSIRSYISLLGGGGGGGGTNHCMSLIHSDK